MTVVPTPQQSILEEDQEQTTTSIVGGNDEDKDIALAGYVSIGFSVFVPSSSSPFTIDDSANSAATEDALSNLLLLFFCSRPHVDLVVPIVSRHADVMSVCPYSDATNDNTAGTDADSTTTVLWSMPLIGSQIRVLELPSGEDDEDGDDERDDEPATTETLMPLTYTEWNFTYPVHQWGRTTSQVDNNNNNNDNSNIYDDASNSQNLLQAELDRSIADGTIDMVLPSWDSNEDAKASVVGQETYYFLGLEEPSSTTTISTTTGGVPADAGKLLQMIGGALMVINTFVVVVLTVLARRHRTREENRIREERNTANNNKQRNSNVMTASNKNSTLSKHASATLHTEEGVSEMLMESKQYAIKYSQNSSNRAMVVTDHRNVSAASSCHKEEKLVAQAKRQHQQQQQRKGPGSIISSGVFSNNPLSNSSSDRDEDGIDHDLEDDDDRVNFSIPASAKAAAATFSQGPPPRTSMSSSRTSKSSDKHDG